MSLGIHLVLISVAVKGINHQLLILNVIPNLNDLFFVLFFCAMKFSGTLNMFLDSIGFHCMVKNIIFRVLQKRKIWNDINVSK